MLLQYKILDWAKRWVLCAQVLKAVSLYREAFGLVLRYFASKSGFECFKCFIISSKVSFLRAGCCSLSNSRFSPLLAVPSVRAEGLLPCKHSVKLTRVKPAQCCEEWGRRRLHFQNYWKWYRQITSGNKSWQTSLRTAGLFKRIHSEQNKVPNYSSMWLLILREHFSLQTKIPFSEINLIATLWAK